MLSCWVEDPDGEAFKKHLARVPDYLWVGEDGMKIQVGADIATIDIYRQLKYMFRKLYSNML